jgi:hypothetical protein
MKLRYSKHCDKHLLFNDRGQLVGMTAYELVEVWLLIRDALEGTSKAPRRWGRLVPSAMTLSKGSLPGKALRTPLTLKEQ